MKCEHSEFPFYPKSNSSETNLLPQRAKINYLTLLSMYLKVRLFSAGSAVVLFKKMVSSLCREHMSLLKFFIICPSICYHFTVVVVFLRTSGLLPYINVCKNWNTNIDFCFRKKRLLIIQNRLLTENQHLMKNPQMVHWIFDHCSPEPALPMEFIYNSLFSLNNSKDFYSFLV